MANITKLINVLHNPIVPTNNIGINKFLYAPEYYNVRAGLTLFTLPSWKNINNLSDEEKVKKFLELGNNYNLLAKAAIPDMNATNENTCDDGKMYSGPTSMSACQLDADRYNNACNNCSYAGTCCLGKCTCSKHTFGPTQDNGLSSVFGKNVTVTATGNQCENVLGKYGVCDSQTNKCSPGYNPILLPNKYKAQALSDGGYPVEDPACVCANKDDLYVNDVDFGCGNIKGNFASGLGRCFKPNTYAYNRYENLYPGDDSRINLDTPKNPRAAGAPCKSDTQCANDCGRPYYGTDNLVCCGGGTFKMGLFGTNDYCLNYATTGQACNGYDKMCASGKCDSNEKCT
jgi:hypothetical protein